MLAIPSWRDRGRCVRWSAVGLIGWFAIACGGSEAQTETPASGTSTGQGADGEEGDSSGGSGEHEPETECVAASDCDVEELCEITTCGGKVSAINHFGCARVACQSDAECPQTERCYPRAMGASCLSSQLDCEQSGDSCECATSNDCTGVLTAHCLPAEFYPVETYCDLEVFECGELSAWHEALRFASTHHGQATNDQLAERLSECSATVVDRRVECGETACGVGCQLSSCSEIDTATCMDACEASTQDSMTIDAKVRELAAASDATCLCDLCAGDADCEATWGC